MTTQIVLGRVYDFERVIGRWGGTGTAFYVPIKVVLGKDNAMYVLNRGHEIIPNVTWQRTGGSARISKLTVGDVSEDEELVGEYLRYGIADDQFIWAGGIALDSAENYYITDEWLNRVSVFDNEGKLLMLWGTAGDGAGQFNRPSGIAIDGDDNVLVVDTLNHRMQKLTKEGNYLTGWGRFGAGEGEFNSPWGICLDREGYVYVVDHKNHRVQKFTPDGLYVASFGSFGRGRGQLNRPSDVDVDPDGDVYVCDWANNRVQVYDKDGKFLTTFIGDAQELSKWARMTVEASPDVAKRRREVGTLEPEWRFEMPTGVTFDAQHNRLIVADTQRARLHIYSKVRDYLEPQRNL